MRKLYDITITHQVIANSFYLEQIAQTAHKSIFVSRSGVPRIVLFGAPLRCKNNLFVQSDDGNITLNAPDGAKNVTIILKDPQNPKTMVQLKSSFEVSDIIITLCREPGRQGHKNLNVPYADVIVILKQLCEKGGVEAQFRAGPLPKNDL